MSHPKRYSFKKEFNGMMKESDGNWVAYEDYKKVEDTLRHYIEQDALRKAGEALHQQNIDSGAYNREKNETIKALKEDLEKEKTDRLDWEEAYAVLRKEHKELKDECNKLRKAVLQVSDIMSNFDRHYFYKIREHLE
jgi:lysyl-tRNA synthetase class II